jgi:ectoine hydroxylase-related dioxygenase (phytanoyl-CoA dioxygenase family)
MDNSRQVIDQRLAAYEHEGYFIVRSLFSPAELEEVTAYILDRVVTRRELPEIQPHKKDKFLRTWCMNERLLDLVEPILGPDIALWTVHCFYKPAKVGVRTPWHQDAPYWEMSPVITASVWLALEKVDRENGCMEVIPKTHGLGVIPHEQLDLDKDPAALGLEIRQGVDFTRRVPVELETGDCSVHHSHLVHGAMANTSGRSRNGLVMRFMPTHCIRRAGDMVLARGVDRSNGQSVYVNPA